MQRQTATKNKPESITSSPLSRGILQRKCACGNQSAGGGECAECGKNKQFLQRRAIHISEPGDRYEQEADRVADLVMRMPEPTAKHQVESEKEGFVQRKASANSITSLQSSSAGQDRLSEVPPIVDEVLRSPGQPLNPDTRAFIEPRFGYDFSSVRVHTDSKSAESAQAVNALAYTVGRDVVFGAGQYALRTTKGIRLLAHELTHTLQQGRVEGVQHTRRKLIQRNLGTYTKAIQKKDWYEAAWHLNGEPKEVISNMLTTLGSPQMIAELHRAARYGLADGSKNELGTCSNIALLTEAEYLKLNPDETSINREECKKGSESESTSKPELPSQDKSKSSASTPTQPSQEKVDDVDEAPLVSEAQAYDSPQSLLHPTIVQIESNLNNIGNRSLMFGANIKRVQLVIKWMNKTLQEGQQLIIDAKGVNEPKRSDMRNAAIARYEAIFIVAPVTYLDVCFLYFADQAENAGQPWPTIQHALTTHNVEITPLLNSVVGFDREKMAQASALGKTKMQEAKVYLEEWSKQIGVGSYWSGNAIAAADAIMIVYSLYEMGSAISGSRGDPPASFKVPLISGITAGGAAMQLVIKIPAEVLEGIRKLIQIGAINAPVIAMGTGITPTLPTLEPPELLLRNTPSGELTPPPVKGFFKGKSVRYEDGRHKHTKLANYTLEELKQAIRNPPKKGALSKLLQAKGAKEYGGQLSKEATDQYEKLVRWAVEDGVEKSGKFYYKAAFEIGIDIETGKATAIYRVDSVPNGAHIIPVSEIPKGAISPTVTQAPPPPILK